MKRLGIFDFGMTWRNPEKRLIFRIEVKVFFRPAMSPASNPIASLSMAVPGPIREVRFPGISERPGTDPSAPSLKRSGGRFQDYCSWQTSCVTSVHPNFLCRLVKEYDVTISNHIKRIEELSVIVISHVDAREYREAHSALDDIEARARAAHAHIDHLQQVCPGVLAPVEDLQE